MKKFFVFILFFVSIFNVFAQYCNTNRFTELPVFTNDQIDSDLGIIYGNALNYNGQYQDLIMNVHSPKLLNDTLEKRPLIVLMHGGSFLSGKLIQLDSVCIEFAKRGFVAATIEYRLGWTAAYNCQTTDSGNVKSINKAIYRSMQDLHASLRYLVNNHSQYKIDTAWIFAGGVSAGAFATVDLAFISQQQFFNRFPYCQSLGNLDTSGNNLTNVFTLKGLFHNWGSIIDIDYITQSNAIPMIAFAGEMDITSPIDSGYYQGCNKFDLMWGSRAIYNKINSLGGCTEINVDIDGGHGVYNQTNAQNLYRVNRASCFFKSLFCADCSSFYNTDSIPANCSYIYTKGEPLKKDEVKIYPNPGKGYFTMESEYIPGNIIQVYNLTGRLVYSSVITSGIQNVDLSNLEEGCYLLRKNDFAGRIVIVK
jgi:poly(3-hydroxybutyrate) depolymerase